MQLSDALYAKADSTWKIALKRLFELVYQVMTETLLLDAEKVEAVLTLDYARTGYKGMLNFDGQHNKAKTTKTGVANKRQLKHA